MKNLFIFLLTLIPFAGKAQTATDLHFDAVNDIVSLPSSPLFNFGTGDFSVEAWIKTSATVVQVIAGAVGGSGDFWLGTSGGKAAFSISGTTLVSSATVNNNQWHHLAGVRQSGTIYIYVDAVLTGSLANSLSFASAGQVFTIGGFGAGYYFAGEVDEVRIWNAAQTGANIAARRNIELVGNETGLLAYYKFNQGIAGGNNTAITTLTNSTANSLDGTLNNFALTGATSNFLSGSPVAALAGALNFDGADDRVSIAAQPCANNSQFTFEGWVYSTSNTQYQTIYAEGYTGSNNQMFSITKQNGTNTGFEIVLRNASAVGLVVSTTVGYVPINTWTHVAFVRKSATTASLYINGVNTDNFTFADPGTFVVDAANLGIRQRLAFDGYFLGSMDEVRIWNRALCQAEIQNNMNGNLNVAAQTGLAEYYQFNQGSVGANNAGITTATDLSGNNKNGTLNNFALTGATSNWVAGTVSSTIAPLSYPGSLAATAGGAQACSNSTIASGGSNFIDASCNLVARVTPSGASPVAGTVNSCVIIDASVQTYKGLRYVQRHYDITPAINASTATGTVTLYYTQAEFDAFNTARGTQPALPASPADATGIANLLITQFHGTGTNPGNYSGSDIVIDPADANIIWDASSTRWEITFNVVGFSGFYVYTSSTSSSLPLRLVNFSGINNAGYSLLQWKTADENNTKAFIVEKSTDGNNFTSIASVQAVGTGNNAYQFKEVTVNGLIYYRLKMLDKDGKFTYSKIIRLNSRQKETVTIYPNPADKTIVLNIVNKNLLHTNAMITDMQGKQVKQFVINDYQQTIDIGHLSKGNYILKLQDGTNVIFSKN